MSAALLAAQCAAESSLSWQDVAVYGITVVSGITLASFFLFAWVASR